MKIGNKDMFVAITFALFITRFHEAAFKVSMIDNWLVHCHSVQFKVYCGLHMCSATYQFFGYPL